jgi:hypothetical protein
MMSIATFDLTAKLNFLMMRLASFMTSRTCALVLVLPWTLAAAGPKNAPAPAAGVKTPGVLIPFAKLKTEAELPLGSAPAGFHFSGDTVVIAESAGAVRRFDAKTNKPYNPSRDAADVTHACGGLAGGFSSLWTATCGDKPALAKIDQPEPSGPARRAPRPEAANAKPEAANAKPEDSPEPPFRAKPSVLAALETPPAATAAIAASQDSIWLLADNRTSLHRIDPATSTPVASIRLPAACGAILFAENALWAVCPNEPKLLRIDPRTNLIDKRIDVPAEPVALAAGEGSIWVFCRKEGKVARIDPKTNKSTAAIELGLPGVAGALAFGEGYLWASAPGYPVMRIAPATDQVVQQFHGPGGGQIAVGAGSVWVGAGDSKTVLRLDPKRIIATLAE